MVNWCSLDRIALTPEDYPEFLNHLTGAELECQLMILKSSSYDECRKLFGGGRLNNPSVDMVSKDLHLHDVRLIDFLTDKYALWLDFRTTDDSSLHGSGRRIENGSEGITLQIEKEADEEGPINVYTYVISDAQMNIENGRLSKLVY